MLFFDLAFIPAQLDVLLEGFPDLYLGLRLQFELSPLLYLHEEALMNLGFFKFAVDFLLFNCMFPATEHLSLPAEESLAESLLEHESYVLRIELYSVEAPRFALTHTALQNRIQGYQKLICVELSELTLRLDHLLLSCPFLLLKLLLHLSLDLLLLDRLFFLKKSFFVLLNFVLHLAVLVLVLLRLLVDLVSGLPHFIQLKICLGCLHRLLCLLLGLSLGKASSFQYFIEVVVASFQIGSCLHPALGLLSATLLSVLARVVPLPRLRLIADLIPLGVVVSVHALLHVSLSQSPFSHFLDSFVPFVHGQTRVDQTSLLGLASRIFLHLFC